MTMTAPPSNAEAPHAPQRTAAGMPDPSTSVSRQPHLAQALLSPDDRLNTRARFLMGHLTYTFQSSEYWTAWFQREEQRSAAQRLADIRARTGSIKDHVAGLVLFEANDPARELVHIASEDPVAFSWIYRRLHAFDWKGLDAIERRLDQAPPPQELQALIRALLSFYSAESLELAAKYLDGGHAEHPELRAALISDIVEAADRPTFAQPARRILKEMLDDPSVEIRAEAIMSFVRLDDRANTATFAQRIGPDTATAERVAAIKALGILDAQRYHTNIIGQADDPELSVLRAVVNAICRYDADVTRSELTRLLDTHDIQRLAAAADTAVGAQSTFSRSLLVEAYDRCNDLRSERARALRAALCKSPYREDDYYRACAEQLLYDDMTTAREQAKRLMGLAASARPGLPFLVYDTATTDPERAALIDHVVSKIKQP